MLKSSRSRMARTYEIDEQIRAAQELSPDGFTILRPVRDKLGTIVDFMWVYENEAIGRLNGTDPGSIVGRRLLDVLPGHINSPFFDAYQYVANTGETRVFEEFFPGTAAAEPRWFRLVVLPIGQNIAILAQDITEGKNAERALRKNEQRFRFALETSQTGSWDLDLTDHTAFRSPEHDRIFGYTELLPEWTYDMFLEHVLPEDRDMVDMKYRRAVETGNDWNFECRIRRTDGEIRWIWAAGRADSEERHGAKRMVGVVQDITERRRAEDTLRESEERFRAFFHNVTVGTAQLDLAGKFIEVNDRFCEITGYSRKEILSGMTIYHLTHPDDRGPQRENLKKYLGGELPFYTAENRYITKDGTVIWVHVTVGMIRDAYGNPRYSAGVIQNITKRKHLEEELHRTQDELELRIAARTSQVNQALETLAQERHRLYEVLETIPAMVCLMTLDHRIIFSNRAFREKFGTPNTQEHCYEHCFGLTEPCDFCQSFTVFETNKPHRWELSGPDGSILDAHNFPFMDVDGTPLVLVMNFDVTEQRRIESERVYLEEQLRQSQKMQAIGTLAGGIAHDFNNMLAVIIGNAELLLDDIETGGDDGTHQVGQILKASKRARDLVKQILTFSRRSDRQKKPLKIVPIIKETAQLLRGSLPSTIHMEMTGTIDADTILADPSQVQQILMNLATNAAYAMRENGGKLTVSYAKRIFMEGDLTPDSAMGPGEYFELTVDDTGIGMPPDIQKRIFEPFFTTKDPGEGTGMGLAVVFGIAQTLRGAVTVKSKVGKGSTFTVFLPLCPETSEEESEESSFPKGNESILVVDDEPSVLEVVTAALRQLGYKVTMARDGSEGLIKFRNHPEAFDLVVTDHVMPDLTGVKLAQKMLQIREDIPIILFSGYSETISPEKARSLGIKEFLMKPIMKRQLAETVRKVLDS